MSSSLINRTDIDFLLFDVFETERLTHLEHFCDHSKETFSATIDLAHNLGVDYFEPHASLVDENEPQMLNQEVKIADEVHQALGQYYAAGFGAATQSYELGGMQLPFSISVACKALLSAANIATYAYSSLSHANANVIKNFANDKLKNLYLPKLLDGTYMGTMALTEPQAGSSLADIQSSAVKQVDGNYLLSGNKIFISAGDHDLSENIVHLVLARIKGAPEGIKGLSLFIVPKFLVNDDGTLGERNDVNLAGLIHKMGYRGTTSTMLSFGEKTGAKAFLIGEPQKGLQYMFQMMNEARIGVGIGAVSLGYTAYLKAVNYARDRAQGRDAKHRVPDGPQQSIIQHADVKRMLLKAKSFVEGGMCLSFYGAQLVDKKTWCTDAQAREKSALLLDILTPILKSWPSKYCLEANSIAIQVHGGYGYTREYPLERLYRDNRLNPIHEGTEGIQSLDLLGRKIMMNNGEAFNYLSSQVEQTIEHSLAIADTKQLGQALHDGWRCLKQTTHALIAVAKQESVEKTLSNSVLYLHSFGHTVVAWLWVKQALVANEKLKTASDTERDFYLGKKHAAQYFLNYELPKAAVDCHILDKNDQTCVDMDANWF